MREEELINLLINESARIKMMENQKKKMGIFERKNLEK